MSNVHIPTNQLKENMIISKDVHARNGLVLVTKGTIVSQEAIILLKNHYIDSVDIEDEDPDIPEQEAALSHEEKRIRQYHQFKAEFEVVKDDVANSLVELVFRNKEIDMQGLIQSLNGIIMQSGNTMELCDMLYYMKETSKGIYTHSINVAILGQLLAGWMKFDKEEAELTGLCGLLHDIGKLKLPNNILNKKDTLTAEEKLQFEKHSIYGYHILKDKKIDGRIKQAVLTHHENLDGSGYPFQVEAKSLTMFSRILSIVDTYDILTSKQPDRDAICPFEAVHIFESDGYNKYDASLLMNFLSNILNNFIQYRVLLSDGQEGEVVFINKANLSRPLVQTKDGFIDLSLKKEIHIVKLLTGDLA